MSVPLPGTDAEDDDPDEVTVQLDSPHRGAGPRGGGPNASDAPVFVDESGRRSRTFRRIGIAVGLACATYAVVIVGTLLSGNAGAPWLPVPGRNDDEPAARVETSDEPISSLTPTPPGFAAPGRPGRTASGPAVLPSGTGAAPSASGSAVVLPSRSAVAPRPLPSGSGRPSPVLTSEPPAPVPSSPAAPPPPPEPSPSTTAEPTPSPSPSPAGGAGTTVAGGAADPVVAGSEPGGGSGPGSGSGSASGSGSGSGEETGTAAASGADPGAGSSPEPGPPPSSSSGPDGASDQITVSITIS
ncbi:translation initiation factor IF-2 [Streptomyces sp. NPDC051051]|uniref:translation initiation factor IF-2 n=1 Tax=Streptomyces sp. NPDC051051 TaxID=3155666 RepID=UPI00343F420C